MTHCQRVRCAGAVIAPAQGGLSLKQATPAVIAYAKAHKVEILAELAQEAELSTYREACGLHSMIDELDRIWQSCDKQKCMRLYNLICSILIEERAPQEFHSVLKSVSSEALTLVKEISNSRVLESRELAKVATKVFSEQPIVTKEMINTGTINTGMINTGTINTGAFA